MSGHVRPRMVVGNWKMYKTHSEAESYFADFIPRIKEATVDVYLAVPYTLIQLASQFVQGTRIVIGAQNMNDAGEGAFTGEIAAKMLVEAGARFVLLGHSERRRLFHESNAFVNRKVKRALQSELCPILCIGEMLADRQSGQTQGVLEQQIQEGLADVTLEQISRVVIAYEPVWAIGTGEAATPEVVQEVHQFVRQRIEAFWGSDLAQHLRVLYGGSVQPQTVGGLIDQPDVDGLLVGGSSLSPELFGQIVNAVQTLPIGKET